MILFFEQFFSQILATVWLITTLGVIWTGPATLLINPPILTSVSGLISVIILMTIGMKSLRRMDSLVHEHVHADTEAAADAEYFAREIVLARKRPLATVLTNPNAMARESADLVRNSLKLGDIEGYRLIFLGAASLQTATIGLEERKFSRSEVEEAPDQVYHGALEEIASKSLRVGRFISLLKTEEFRNRNPVVRNRYLSWLTSQLGQMKRNPNYILVDCQRAPKWGALGAMIISQDQLIQFSHPNGAALSIRDRRLVLAIVRSSIIEIQQSKQTNLKAYVRDPDGVIADDSIYTITNIEEFSKRIEAYEESLKRTV
jgi:hypothetical protein